MAFAERFDIEHAFASGAMGTVHAAVDLQTGARVALKVLHPEARAPRFEREARVLAEIEHPGVVRYVDHGVTPEGQRYLAMEWLDGCDLAQALARAPLAVRESLELARRLAEALAAAHAAGVVHRDVKPGNVFLVGGAVSGTKLVDFGVARARDAFRTATGAIVGTLSYMAPEQARGDKDVDGRADLFALGCVLYECLTGARPFAAPTPLEVRIKVVTEEPTRVAKLRPDLPPVVDGLVHQLLAKSPDARVPDALAAAAMLAGLRTVDGAAPGREPRIEQVRGESTTCIEDPTQADSRAPPRRAP